MFKLCEKFEQNRAIRCRVIDDLAHYCREILEGVVFPLKDLRGAWSELYQIRPPSLLTEFVSELRYLAPFLYVAPSKLSDVENEAKFRTF